VGAQSPERLTSTFDEIPGWISSCVDHEEEGDTMPTCEVCGNDYDKAFEVVAQGQSHTFDSFECAIHRLAPTCAHCHCHIIGHGVEAGGRMYCCANCARHSGSTAVKDRA
jgi:hypothetical protein